MSTRHDENEGNVSWSESEESLPGSGRKRESKSPQETPASKRIKQLETPPNTSRTNRVLFGVDSALRKCLDETEDLQQLLASPGKDLSRSSVKLREHIQRQGRLLIATSRSRDELKKALGDANARCQRLSEQLSLTQAQSTTDRASIAALRREIAALRSA